MNWGRILKTIDCKLGDELGSDVGSSDGKPGCERARARSALEPFQFWKYLFFPCWFAMLGNSFYHFLVDETTGMDSCIYTMTDDVDVAEAYKEAHQ